MSQSFRLSFRLEQPPYRLERAAEEPRHFGGARFASGALERVQFLYARISP
jgi:hypothetical protein